jgi:phosphopantothenoylcysteine decarboxylase/phosphopantothenate--cysteine ligase
VGGGIAAYKALELTRLLRKAGVACGRSSPRGRQFVTPLSLSRSPRTRSIATSSR